MTTVFGGIGAQTFVVLIIAVIGLVPVALYYRKTPTVFVVPYVFLFVAAFATNFENLFLPDVLNFTEHLVGNLGAGLSFAAGAYVYRQRSITGTDKTGAGRAVDTEPEG